MRLTRYLGSFLGALLVASCGATTVQSPPADPNLARLIAYTSDEDLSRLKLDEVSPLAVYEALDPTKPKRSEFAKSEYETEAAWVERRSSIAGPDRRYVVVVPALLEYDADLGEAAFCPVWTQLTKPECLPKIRSTTKVDLDTAGAGAFVFFYGLDVATNKLSAPLFPLKLPVELDEARRVDEAGTARVAIVFSLDEPFSDGRFAQTTGTPYEQNKRARVIIRRVVAYEQGGKVLSARDVGGKAG